MLAETMLVKCLKMNLRDQGIISSLLKHEVHMTWPVGMTVQHLEQLSHRPVMRDGIRYRDNGLEPKVPLFIARQYRSTIRACPIRVLHVVETLRICLPDIDLGI